MTNFSQLATELGLLSSKFESLNTYLNRTPINKYLKQQERFAKEFDKFTKIPIIKNGLDELKSLGKAMKRLSDLNNRSLATEKDLIQTISFDQVAASVSLGVGLEEMTTQIIALREKGVEKLDKSTLGLLARMKITGQSTEALIKFLGANTSYLMLNQREAQHLAANLAHFSRIYGTRQDEILRLTADLSKNLQIQSQLGAGAGVAGGFGAFGASLGGRGTELIQQAVQFFSKASYGQLQLLGIAEGFQEKLANETNPARQKAIVEQMIQTAAGTIKNLQGGLGKDVMSSKIFEQLLQPYGGQAALIFPQLAKAMEDAKDPIDNLSNSMMGFSQLANVFATPMNYLAAALTSFINFPGIKQLAQGLALFAGVVLPLRSAMRLFQMGQFIFANRARVFELAVAKFGLDVKAFAVASKFSMGPWGWVLGALTGAAAIALGVDAMASDINEINDKTLDPREKGSSNLSNSIFSQLINIVTNTNQGYIQRETLNTQKELLRLVKQQNDWSSPNNSPASRPPERKIGGGIGGSR